MQIPVATTQPATMPRVAVIALAAAMVVLCFVALTPGSADTTAHTGAATELPADDDAAATELPYGYTARDFGFTTLEECRTFFARAPRGPRYQVGGQPLACFRCRSVPSFSRGCPICQSYCRIPPSNDNTRRRRRL